MKLVASMIGSVLLLGALAIALWLTWQYWTVAIDQTRQRFFWNYWPQEVGMMILGGLAAGCYELAKD